jgi:hypothetical protein
MILNKFHWFGWFNGLETKVLLFTRQIFEKMGQLYRRTTKQ